MTHLNGCYLNVAKQFGVDSGMGSQNELVA